MIVEFPTLLRFAWKDGKRHWRHGLLFALTLFVGLGTLATVRFYSDAASHSLEQRAQMLLGADLQLQSNFPFTEQQLDRLNRIPGKTHTVRESRIMSMVHEPQKSRSRLVQVRGIDPGFPFYGTLRTNPPSSWNGLQDDAVILDESLALQWELSAGDPIQIGQQTFHVTGILHTIPGESLAAGTFVPRVWIHYDRLKDTGLLEQGSIVRHYMHICSDDPIGLQQWLDRYRSNFEGESVQLHTPQSRRDETGNLLQQLESFLSLAGLAALLLGSIGLISATRIYLKSKEPQVALLRCIGISPLLATAPFLLQMLLLSLLATAAGILFGILGQSALLHLMAPLLPVEIATRFSWIRILEVFLTGTVVFIFCTVPPLLSMRKLSPLAALRNDYTPTRTPWWRDSSLLVTLALGTAGFLLLALIFSPNLIWAGWFLFATATCLLALLVIGKTLLGISRLPFISKLPFLWHHGIANMHRPKNRTLQQILILGTGGVLLLTIATASHLLLQQTLLVRQDSDPDMIFFDIQPDQKEAFRDLVIRSGYSVHELAPVVTARLQRLNGDTLQQLQLQSKNIEEWAFHREYRLSWRNYLVSNESVIEGEWITDWDHREPIPISVAERVIKALDLKLGDRMLFDIQGVPVDTQIANIRKVEWRQVQTNFFIIFPPGVLEDAPRFYISSIRTGSSQDAVRLQQEVHRSFPNISSVSLGQIMDTLQEIFDQAAWILHWVGSVAIITGVIVLIGTLLGGRQERIREIALWRLLGLEVGRIRWLLAIEYSVIGFLVALAAICISLATGVILARWIFNTPVSYPLASFCLFLILTPITTLLLGWLFGSRIQQESPLTTVAK